MTGGVNGSFFRFDFRFCFHSRFCFGFGFRDYDGDSVVGKSSSRLLQRHVTTLPDPSPS